MTDFPDRISAGATQLGLPLANSHEVDEGGRVDNASVLPEPETPLDPEAQAALLLSLIPGIGPKTYARLVKSLGSPAAALNAAPDQLRRVYGISAKLMQQIVAARNDPSAMHQELARCRKHQINLVTHGHPRFPARLREIEDPPTLLFCRGQFDQRDDLAIGIVGTRHASIYGKIQAERLARELAMTGFTVVSGLARGIDAAAHRGALAAEGRTIAVLGSGLANIYPPEHDELADQVVKSGVVCSEYPTMQNPRSGVFPARNRIIAGFCLGIIVVEAPLKSGALITARHAMEQGREVFAMPGRVDSRTSRGCHQLIRDGARLIESVDDVLEELGPLATPATTSEDRTVRHPAELALGEQEQAVLAAIDTDPISIDEVVARTGLPVPRVLSTISVLEMRRLVQRVMGSKVVRR